MPQELWEPLPPEVKRHFLHTLELYKDAHKSWIKYYDQTFELKDTIKGLEHQVKQLQGQLVETRKELEIARRSEKRQAAPFSKGPPKENPRRPGRPVGHPPAFRPVPATVDQVLEVPLCCCPDCQQQVTPDRLDEQFIEDLDSSLTVVSRVHHSQLHDLCRLTAVARFLASRLLCQQAVANT